MSIPVFISLLAVSCASLNPKANTQYPDFSTAIAKAEKFTVRIEPIPKGDRQQNPPETSMGARVGSGILISAGGEIVTNRHGVGDEKTMLVTLIDGRQFEAKVLEAHPDEDLALLKIDASGLPLAQLQPGRTAKVGEWVLALGFPLGGSLFVTQGIVSAIDVSIPFSNGEPYLQTNLVLTRGYSGDPGAIHEM